MLAPHLWLILCQPLREAVDRGLMPPNRLLLLFNNFQQLLDRDTPVQSILANLSYIHDQIQNDHDDRHRHVQPCAAVVGVRCSHRYGL